MFGPSQPAKPAMTSKSYQIILWQVFPAQKEPKYLKINSPTWKKGKFTILWMPGPPNVEVESSTWDDTPDKKTLLLLLLRDVQRIGIRAPRSLVNARSDIPLEKMSSLTWQYHHSSPAKKIHQSSRISKITAWKHPSTWLHAYLQVAPHFQDSIQPSRYDHHLSLARKVVVSYDLEDDGMIWMKGKV